MPADLDEELRGIGPLGSWLSLACILPDVGSKRAEAELEELLAIAERALDEAERATHTSRANDEAEMASSSRGR